MSKPWYTRQRRILQFNIEDPYGYMLEEIKPQELVDLAEKLHADTLVIFARDGWGRAFYQSKVYPPHPKMRNDFLKEIMEHARNKNIKVVVMIAHTSNKWLYREHPDWIQRNIEGDIITLDSIPSDINVEDYEWPLACLNSPFREIILSEVEETLEYDVDALMLDSFRYQPDFERACYCDYCKREFKKKTGYDLPSKQDWNSIEWRTAWEWRYNVVVERIKEIKEKIKQMGKYDIPLIYNSHPAGWSGRIPKIVEKAREHLDVIFAECSEVDHEPLGFLTEMTKLSQALSGGKPVWTSRNYFHIYRSPTATTPEAIKQGIWEIFASGGSPLVLIFLSAYIQDKRLLNTIAEIYSKIEKIEEYMEDTEPVKHTAVVFSCNTRDWYGRDHPEPYTSEVRGFFYAHLYSNIPVDFIADSDIVYDKLKQYKCVILANTACLSNSQTEEIRKYAKNGGGVVATYQTSLYNEKGYERYDFTLQDLIGGHYYGIKKIPWSYIKLVREHDIVKSLSTELILWGDMSYEFKNTRVEEGLAYHVLVSPYTGVPIAKVVDVINDYGFEYTLGKSPPPAWRETETPAIMVNELPSGKVVYFTGQLGRMFWRTGLSEYQKLIINTTKWASKGGLPFETNAPETVRILMYKTKDQERIVIHLVNQTVNQRILLRPTGGSKYKTPGYSGSVAVHPVRQVIPVYNIRIKVPVKEPEKIKVYSPLEDKEIQYKVEREHIVINVDKLEDYKLLVIEYK